MFTVKPYVLMPEAIFMNKDKIFLSALKMFLVRLLLICKCVKVALKMKKCGWKGTVQCW